MTRPSYEHGDFSLACRRDRRRRFWRLSCWQIRRESRHHAHGDAERLVELPEEMTYLEAGAEADALELATVCANEASWLLRQRRPVDREL